MMCMGDSGTYIAGRKLTIICTFSKSSWLLRLFQSNNNFSRDFFQFKIPLSRIFYKILWINIMNCNSDFQLSPKVSKECTLIIKLDWQGFEGGKKKKRLQKATELLRPFVHINSLVWSHREVLISESSFFFEKGKI